MEVFIQFEKNPLLFQHPRSVIYCGDPASLPDAFDKMEEALQNGFYVAGLLSYEAGYCFEERLRQDKRYAFPLMLMGVYEQPLSRLLRPKQRRTFLLRDTRINTPFAQYAAHIEAIRDHIAQGDVYQITYCVKFHFRFLGDPLALYAELLRRQPVPYPAYIDAGRFQVLSLSPERFVKRQGDFTTTEPMKGTWARGRNVFSDAAARRRFACDPKNRAENLMITDLLRNDLGRVGGDVRVPKLFTVAAYRTLYQMTSTVTAHVLRDVPLYRLFFSLFPSGSVTGAPKIRAMQIIRGLENEERKIYTGAIGFVAPNRDLYFNVPIRTVLIEGEAAEMGVGGGIVWDSTPQGEWEEGLLKASFLTELAARHG